MHCLTPLHAGRGQDIGAIDLPIQRESHSQLPKCEASGLKGALREAHTDQATTEMLYGPEHDPDRRGSMGFSNARLLLFPVKSIKGIFTWVTCPFVLSQLERDLSWVQGWEGIQLKLSHEPEEKDCIALGNRFLVGQGDSKYAILEEFAFEVKEGSCSFKVQDDEIPLGKFLAQNLFADEPKWQAEMEGKIAIISDDLFRDFTIFYSEVNTRIKIDAATGTVTPGGLFTVEFLPQESILYSVVSAHSEFSKENPKTAAQVEASFRKGTPSHLQMGGEATLGKGWVKLNLQNGIS